uniref:Uncharacterized protein n=1 Tax=Chromera velia CCMP2878 TaxID=1169474 RepID=A0A0G4GSJ8_9ALVE|eukprot:Cvel_23140.t1-p1 / transcript=Cvel_23140.t1 / gene=Cvel_23140 / organism=Chromera_velia_CCMP2878 / gene_product=Coiled-coil domain-containing protein 57, putative / transcript_product=Coiled-coil domain-containing protein 57, putative / location=Cvel_scaffold2352:10542-22244(+) / protein_length=1048 / sequence_SO=supercontig / SO=protein_coding / is_pseudo=false
MMSRSMNASMLNASTSLKDSRHQERLLQKEREYREAWEGQYLELEEQLTRKEEEVRSLTANLNRLQEDFNYNLGLIAERDAELEKYDKAFNAISSGVNEKDKEMAVMKLQVTTLQEKLQAEQNAHAEDSERFRQRLETLTADLAKQRSDHEREMRKKQETFDNFKMETRRQVMLKSEELDGRRKEELLKFEEESRLLRREIADLCGQRELLQSSLRAREAQIGELEARVSSLCGECEEGREAVGVAREEGRRLAVLLSDSESRVRTLEREREESEEEKRSLKARLQGTTKHCEALESMWQDAQRELNTLRAQRDALGREVERWKERHVEDLERAQEKSRAFEREIEKIQLEAQEQRKMLTRESEDKVLAVAEQHARREEAVSEEHAKRLKDAAAVHEESVSRLILERDRREEEMRRRFEEERKNREKEAACLSEELGSLKETLQDERQRHRATAHALEAERIEARAEALRTADLVGRVEGEARSLPGVKREAESLRTEVAGLEERLEASEAEKRLAAQREAEAKEEAAAAGMRYETHIAELKAEVARLKALSALPPPSTTSPPALTAPAQQSQALAAPLFPGDMGPARLLTPPSFSPSLIGGKGETEKEDKTAGEGKGIPRIIAPPSSSSPRGEVDLGGPASSSLVQVDMRRMLEDTKRQVAVLAAERASLLQTLQQQQQQQSSGQTGGGDDGSAVEREQERDKQNKNSLSMLTAEVQRLQSERSQLMEISNRLKAEVDEQKRQVASLVLKDQQRDREKEREREQMNKLPVQGHETVPPVRSSLYVQMAAQPRTLPFSSTQQTQHWPLTAAPRGPSGARANLPGERAGFSPPKQASCASHTVSAARAREGRLSVNSPPREGPVKIRALPPVGGAGRGSGGTDEAEKGKQLCSMWPSLEDVDNGGDGTERRSIREKLAAARSALESFSLSPPARAGGVPERDRQMLACLGGEGPGASGSAALGGGGPARGGVVSLSPATAALRRSGEDTAEKIRAIQERRRDLLANRSERLQLLHTGGIGEAGGEPLGGVGESRPSRTFSPPTRRNPWR